jgi:hypothetical protein
VKRKKEKKTVKSGKKCERDRMVLHADAKTAAIPIFSGFSHRK